MRLLTFFTPSHQAMCERFVLSRANEFSEVIAREYPQRCATGVYKSEGWNECMDDKLDAILNLPPDGYPTLYVDADVALFAGLAGWASSKIAAMDHDEIAYGDDVVQWCAGVILFRPTARTLRWWRLVADMCQLLQHSDQGVIHFLRRNAKKLPVPMSVLPREQICNWATIGNRGVWRGEPFDVPSGCLAWHANWTLGIEAKVEMLERATQPKPTEANAEAPQVRPLPGGASQ